ncbi:MAG: phage major capsid protein [Phycisphaerales bacterium]
MTKSPPDPGETGDEAAPDISTMDRHQLAAEIKACNETIAEFDAKGGPDLKGLSDDEAADLSFMLDFRDELKAELAKRPDPRAIKARMGVTTSATQPESATKASNGHAPRRPSLGGRTVAGDGSSPDAPKGGDTKSEFLEFLESEDDKFIKAGGDFRGLGEFGVAIYRSGSTMPGRILDDSKLGRWNARVGKIDTAMKGWTADMKAASGLSEFSDSDGAAFVPPQMATDIWERATADETNLLSMVDTIPVSGNGYTQHAWNDKSRTSGLLYGGASAYWGAEADEKTGTKPTTRKIEWKLNKLYVLFFATDELLEDTVALDQKLARVAAKCFTYKINDAIINGDGVGKPLGLLASAAKITVSAVSGQGTNTIIGSNVSSMWKRRSPQSESNLVWLYNVGIEDYLDQLSFTTGANTNTASAQFMYLPVGGLRDLQQPRLKGRPMYECEHCPALGTAGDLILWDPTSYGAIVKTTGINSAVSMHVRFIYDETAFRWTFRLDGRPYWDAPLTPPTGDTRSPIVILNSTRS